MYYATATFALASLGVEANTHGFASLNRALCATLKLCASMPASDAAHKVVKGLCSSDRELATLVIKRYAKKPRFIAVFGHSRPKLEAFLSRLAEILAP